MGFRTDSYATVWEVKPQNERRTKLRISISRRNTQNDGYETDFSGWVDVYGTVPAAKAAKLKPKDRIKLKAVDVSNNYDKEKNVTYWNPKIFEFEPENESTDSGDGGGHSSNTRNSSSRGNNSRGSRRAQAAYEGEDEDEGAELPF